VLKEKLEAKIQPADKKYMKLTSFTRQKSVYTFDDEEWLKDALKDVKGRLYLSKWDKEFSLQIRLPRMVLINGMTAYMEKHIAFLFSKYIERKPDVKKKLLSVVPESVEKMLRLDPLRMFDFSYVYMSNKVIAKLKQQYAIMILYAINAMTSKSKVEAGNRPFKLV
jgi:hypothetical protein